MERRYWTSAEEAPEDFFRTIEVLNRPNTHFTDTLNVAAPQKSLFSWWHGPEHEIYMHK